MKMTLTELLAEELVASLVDGAFILTEDRIDDIIAKYPDAKLDRRNIESWMEFDPTRNKKYMPWIVTQVAKGTLKLPEQGEVVRDDLMTFERLLTIPAYEGQRDIWQVKTFEELHGLVVQHGEIRSKTSQEREKKEAGVDVVAKQGNLTLLKITSANALNSWGWRAYSHPVENPNWAPRKPIRPEDIPPGDISDRKWCIRWPRYAETYLSSGPFYLVLKNGGPYVGIVWEKGECQSLDNEGISTAVAEEIYPVIKDVLPTNLQRNCKVFDNLKFLAGDVPDGSTVTGPIDLSGTKLTKLPNNLTVRGALNISNTPMTQLPTALRVEGCLKINGTQITDLPEDLTVEDVEWSEPLDWSKMKSLFYRMRLPEMLNHYKTYLKDQAKLPPEQREKDPKTGKPKKNLTVAGMAKALVKYFQVDPEVDTHVRTVYRYIAPKAAETPEQ
jgi:hypothetical protein